MHVELVLLRLQLCLCVLQFTEDLRAVTADPVCPDLFFAELPGRPSRGSDGNEFVEVVLKA
jgi:hypothetical protein